MTEPDDTKDPWVEALRRTREAAERLREHLRPTPPAAPPPAAPTSPAGTPCE